MAEANDIDAQMESRRNDAQTVNIALSGLAVAAGLAFWLGGAIFHLTSVIVMALVPVPIIYLLNSKPQLYTFGKPRRNSTDPRTDLIYAFMACLFGLILGDGDVYFAGNDLLLKCAVLMGALFGVTLFVPLRRSPQFWFSIFIIPLLGGFYGWKLAGAVDSLPDKSPPAHYSATVVDKNESQGRGTSYHLTLAPWGPVQGADSLTVSHAVYDSAIIGNPVCLELHPGLLHLQWYRMVACDDSDQQPAPGDQ